MRAEPVHLRPDGTIGGRDCSAARNLPSEIYELLRRPAWHADAACREHPEIDFFPTRGQPTEPAKAVCAGCLVRDDCLAFVLEHEDSLHRVGIWAGTSARERQRRRAGSRAEPAAG